VRFYPPAATDNGNLIAQLLRVAQEQKQVHLPFEQFSLPRPDEQNAPGLAPGNLILRGDDIIMSFELDNIGLHSGHLNYTMKQRLYLERTEAWGEILSVCEAGGFGACLTN
jgi:hypothetical protein